VSTRRPRYRYIAFRVDGPRAFTEDEVLQAIRALPDRPWLVGFSGVAGLVRCVHLRKEETIEALRGMIRVAGVDVRVTTLGTSGTIRRATSKYLRKRTESPSGDRQK